MPVARALLAFTSEPSEKRVGLSVGIDEGDVCATDGKGLVRFQRVTIEAAAPHPPSLNGQYWPREVLEAAIKAAGRAGAVALPWSGLASGFPGCAKAEPADGSTRIERGIGIDVQLIGRLELVARAVRRGRKDNESAVELPPLPYAIMTSVGDELDPMRFAIGGSYYMAETAHEAFVTIMPLRHWTNNRTSTRQPKARAKRKAKASVSS